MTTYLVPVLIDQTGLGADVSNAIQGWIDGTIVTGGFPAPTDGASSGSRNTIKLQAGATYRCNKGTGFTQFSNMDVDWNGGGFLADTDTPYGIESTAIDFATSTFTCNKHGLDGTMPMSIGSGVKNSLGIVNHGSYWPLIVDPGRFQLSLSQGGSPITVTTRPQTPAEIAAHKAVVPDTKFNFTNAPVTNLVNGVNNPSNLRPWLFSNDFAGNANDARRHVLVEACVNFRTMTSAARGTIQGSQISVDGRSGTYNPLYEGQTAIQVLGGTNIEISDFNAIETRGDGISCIKSSLFNQRTNGLWAHDFSVTAPGRHGCSVGNQGAQHVLIEDYRIDGAPRHAFDIEDDTANGSGIIDDVVIQRGWARGGSIVAPNNLNLWIALGGNSINETNIRIGGAFGSPLDGNVAVGFIHGMAIDWHVLNSTARRGPLVINYNVGGGSVALTTTAGSATATYSGVLNNSSFSDTDVMRFQSIAASTLPATCRIDAVNETTHTVTLSHPANAGTGTQIVTAVFGNPFSTAAPGGPFAPVQWDGVQGVGNVVVLRPGIGDVAFYCNKCSAVDVHDNIVFGGGELANVNPVAASTDHITGSEAVTFTGTGTITSTALDPMTGTAPVVFSASGALAHIRNLSGSADFAFVGAGAFDDTVPSTDELFAVADVVFAAVGTLSLHQQSIEGVGSVVERGPGFGAGRFGRGFFGGLPG